MQKRKQRVGELKLARGHTTLCTALQAALCVGEPSLAWNACLLDAHNVVGKLDFRVVLPFRAKEDSGEDHEPERQTHDVAAALDVSLRLIGHTRRTWYYADIRKGRLSNSPTTDCRNNVRTRCG